MIRMKNVAGLVLNSLFSCLIDQIKENEMGWHVARIGEMKNAYSILVGKNLRKRPLGRFRRRWEDNIRMDLRKIDWKVVEWIHLAQVGTRGELCEHCNELSGSIKGEEFFTI
jgi:hypothetical protein